MTQLQKYQNVFKKLKTETETTKNKKGFTLKIHTTNWSGEPQIQIMNFDLKGNDTFNYSKPFSLGI